MPPAFERFLPLTVLVHCRGRLLLPFTLLLPSELSLEVLEKKIRSFNPELTQEFVLFFQDDEGDCCVIRTNEELNEAVVCQDSITPNTHVLTLFIKEDKKATPLPSDGPSPLALTSLGLGDEWVEINHPETQQKPPAADLKNYVSQIQFNLNGQAITLNNVDPTVKLSEYLRSNGHTGTKVMCHEGGCGACTVTMTYVDAQGNTRSIPINACLRPLCSLNGASITTTEGIGSVRSGLHPIQQRLAENNGSQCGFCSPGMVMTMYSFLQSNPQPTAEEIEDNFGGNICRCTGYRPILDAFKSFAKKEPKLCKKDSNKICSGKCHHDGKESTPSCSSDIEDICGKNKYPHYDPKKYPSPAPVKLDHKQPVKSQGTASGVSYFAPTDLNSAYSLMMQYSDQDPMLMVGNTSTGIYKDIHPSVIIDIRGIPQLQTKTATNNSLVVGSAVSIEDLIALLEKNISSSTSFPAMIAHLHKVAGKQIRSIASWAGNLMVCHDHEFFPSDVYTVLCAGGTYLNIADLSSGVPVISTVNMTAFLDLDMSDKMILSMNIPFLANGPSARQVVLTYKVMPRYQNAHAVVNAGFNIVIDYNMKVLAPPLILFGGVKSSPARATDTEQFLNGKTLDNSQVLQQALAILMKEMVPEVPPADPKTRIKSGPKTEYRGALPLTLFYKFFLSLQSKVQPKYQSATVPYERPLSSGQQDFDTQPGLFPVTQPLPKIEGPIQASGEAIYTNDIQLPSGGLYAAFVYSTQANADILSIDASAALAAPGVFRVLTAADIPQGGSNNTAIPGGSVVEELFASKSVDYYGQAVALVVADTQAHADGAVFLVKVNYTNIKTPVLTIQDAIKYNSYWDFPIPPVTQGDVNQGFKDSTHIIEGSFGVPHQYHFHMETHSSFALPQDGDRLMVYAAVQFPSATQGAISTVIGQPLSKVTVDVKRLGGAYGGKIDRSIPPACAVGLAAYVLKRPVKMMMTLSTNMLMMGKRLPYHTQYKVGTDDNGLLKALQMTVWGDAGNCPNNSGPCMFAVAFAVDNVYNCPNWDATFKLCKTNLAGNTAMRGPGFVPGVFIIEHIMDHVSSVVGKPPAQVREINFYGQNQVTPYGQTLYWNNIEKVWADLKTSSDYDARCAQIAQYNSQNVWTKRGLYMTPVKYGVPWSPVNYGAQINITADGTVQVTHAGVECGQGINTKVVQVVSSILGVPTNKIQVYSTSTLSVPNGGCTGGSITSELVCFSVKKACDKLKARLAPIQLTQAAGTTWEQIVALCIRGGMQLYDIGWVNETQPQVFKYVCYGAAATEVQVDVLTGEVQVKRADITFDVGDSMNPDVDVGQVEGAFVMGLGYHLSEELVVDPTTGSVTDSTWEYKPPCSKSHPEDFRVRLLRNTPNPIGFLGSKAIGEPPYCSANSSFFAVRAAMTSARNDAGLTDYFPLHAPATCEYVQLGCGVSPTRLTL